MDRQQQTLQRSTFSSCRLVSYMDAVCDDRTALDVTRQNARSVVMISADGYRELMETVHLLKNQANAVRLIQSIQEGDGGKLQERALVEAAQFNPNAG